MDCMYIWNLCIFGIYVYKLMPSQNKQLANNNGLWYGTSY